ARPRHPPPRPRASHAPPPCHPPVRRLRRGDIGEREPGRQAGRHRRRRARGPRRGHPPGLPLRPFTLLEASDRVGGRVATDEVDGYLLDRGFQIFLTAYPECQRLLDYQALRLQPFFPGALVYLGAGDGGSPFHMLSDPFRFPIRSLSSVFSPVGIARVAVFSSGAAPSLTPSRAAASLPTASSAASISLLVADLARAESWLETALKDSAHGRSPETWGKAGSRVVLAPPRMVPAAVAAREDTALTARTTRAAAA
uniref:Amine oxidase domain-containing protein n=1 Tax=Aegilops tauschii subsp. strangulata TaxID=200361 RepID=A0A453C7S1_AEGTS